MDYAMTAMCSTCDQPYGAHNGLSCPDEGENKYSGRMKFVDNGKHAKHSGYDPARNRVSKRDRMDEVCANCNIRSGQHYTPNGRTICPTPDFEFPKDSDPIRYFQWNGAYRDYDTDYRDRKALYRSGPATTVAPSRLKLHVGRKLLLLERQP